MKNTLVNLINVELARRGWNQKRLEKESHVNQATISRLLNGCVNIKVESIFAILCSLDLLRDKEVNIGKEEAACRSGTPPDEYLEKAGAVLKSDDARLVKDFKKEILYFFEESRGLKQTMQNPTSEDGESLIQGHEAKKKTVA